MDEVERILRLLSEGKITKEEAERLLAALEGDKAAPEPGGVLHIDAELGAVRVRRAQDGTLRASSQGRGAIDLRREGLTAWLKARGGEGLRVGPLTLGKSQLKIDVWLPEGWGVDLRMGMGSFRADALAFLRGKLSMGEVHVDRLEGLDFHLSMGEFVAGLAVRSGRHTLRVSMGEVRLRVLPGASLRVEGGTSMGGFKGGVYGGGAAVLEVHAGMGSVHVENGGEGAPS